MFTYKRLVGYSLDKWCQKPLQVLCRVAGGSCIAIYINKRVMMSKGVLCITDFMLNEAQKWPLYKLTVHNLIRTFCILQSS